MQADDLLGAWALVSFTERRDEAVLRYPLGEDARGFIMYTPQGFMSAQMQDAVNGPIAAYAGRWTLKDGLLQHHIELDSVPARLATVVDRYPHLDGEILTLESPRILTPHGADYLRIVWRRAR
jgi:hypothetical protein